MEQKRLKPRQQGDLGELSAMQRLAEKGARIFVPIGHSPDVDLIAEVGDRLLRIEVKSTTSRNQRDDWCVQVATRGGNQSWSGVVKYFEPERCEFLFVHVGDGRRWLIPSAAVEARTALTVGGSKYAEFEIEPGRPIPPLGPATPLESTAAQGEYRSGQTGRPVKALAQPSQVRILPPPSAPLCSSELRPSKYERKLGRSGQAIINQKRRVTIPQQAFFEAGFDNGARVRVRSDGPGRVILERGALPSWARREGPDDAHESAGTDQEA